MTTASGDYSIAAVPDGTYRVFFDDQASAHGSARNNSSVWLGNGQYEGQSEILTVAGGAVNNVDAILPIGASIAGHVGFASPITNVIVSAFLLNSLTGAFERFPVGAVPDSLGYFVIEDVPPGKTLVRFADDANGEATTEYFDEAYYYAYDPTTFLQVDPGEVITGINGTLDANSFNVQQFAGANRFDTSVAISQNGWLTGSKFAFVVNGMSFADALSAGPAAGNLEAPVLLANTASLPATVADELVRLNPDVIIIVGGTGVVSAGVEAQLNALMPSDAPVLRIGGANRYETSRNVAGEFWLPDSAPTAYLATGADFPDALGAGPAAGNEYGPVILVQGSASSLDQATKNTLDYLGAHRVIIAGGTGVISPALEQSVKAVPFLDEVHRRSGSNRYNTAVKIGEFSFPLADTVLLANGSNFPDALAGTALAGYWFAPIYLVKQNCIPRLVLDEILRLKPIDIILLGGTGVLGSGVANLQQCPGEGPYLTNLQVNILAPGDASELGFTRSPVDRVAKGDD
jgi:putative cell wall-binding protein